MLSINAAYQWAVEKCVADYVRYSMQWDLRDGVYRNGLQYFDCSSFIFWALNAGGFPVVEIFGNNAFNTDSMGAVLLQMGFVEISRTGLIMPGDIGVHHRGSAGGHTEMCHTGGNGVARWMGAHSSNLPAAQQVSIDDGTLPGTFWDEIYRFQGGIAVGPSNYVIAAMCGNFFQESGVNPGVWESLVERNWDSMYYQNTGGYGLGQWTNTSSNSMRLLNLHNWVNSNGYSDGDGYGQLAFLIHENVWMKNSIETSAYNNLTEFLTSNSTDIDALTKEYFFHWEGINNGTLSQRQQFAHQAYDYIVAHYNDTNINTWVSGNRYISQSDALNNCVLIARFLSTGYAPYQVKMKIWLAKRHWIRKRRMKM